MKHHIKLSILCGSIAALLGVAPALATQPTATNQTPPKKEANPSASQPFDGWSDRVFNEFQGMEQRIDQIFHEASRDLNPRADWLDNGGFSSSLKLSDQKDAYVVRLALPERDPNKLSATVDANNTLRIVAQEEQKEKTTSADKAGGKDAGNSTYIMGRFEQVLSLPGPVDASKIKIDRSGNSVTVTVPKAEPAAHALPKS